MPCTTLLVGKDASYDGSTLMARNEDSLGQAFTAKKLSVVLPADQPRLYKSILSGIEIELPDNPQRYTAMPNALPDSGFWGAAGINESNVAMSATETISSNPLVQGADPLVEPGLGEEDFLCIVLPYIHSAREGVLRLGELLELFGTCEMNGIGFQDQEEIWWMETIGGHHWIAKRVPDDRYVVMPNQQGIDSFDLSDAFGAKKDHLCSADLLSFITENHLAPSARKSPEQLLDSKCFDVRRAFGSRADSDSVFSTPRAWDMLRFFNPHTFSAENRDIGFSPESFELPWSMVPERRVTVEDVKYVLSSHYQGTCYDPYGEYGSATMRGKYRPIGSNRTNALVLTQLRPYMPDDMKALEWVAMGSNVFNAFIPQYANVNKAPLYLENTGSAISTDSFYWVNRIIGALADAHYSRCKYCIDGYQKKVANLSHALLSRFDHDAHGHVDIHTYLEACNDRFAEMARSMTEELLSTVLDEASNAMKNGYSDPEIGLPDYSML